VSSRVHRRSFPTLSPSVPKPACPRASSALPRGVYSLGRIFYIRQLGAIVHPTRNRRRHLARKDATRFRRRICEPVFAPRGSARMTTDLCRECAALLPRRRRNLG
jgi:hypothetical protein